MCAMIAEKDNKKKILFIDFGSGFGGSVVNLAKILAVKDRLGIETYVLTDHCDPESLRILQRHAAEVLYLRRQKPGIFMERSICQCGCVFIKKFLYLLSLIVKTLLNIPFYIRVKGFARKISADLVQFNNVMDFDEVVLAWLIGKKTVCHAQRMVGSSGVTRFCLKSADIVVAISEYVKQGILKAGVTEEKIVLIHNAVDIDQINELATKGLDQFCDIPNFEGYKVGLFGCLLPWKGQDVLIDAVDIFVNRMKIRSGCFFIVGGSPGKDYAYEASLKERVRSLGLEHHIQFAGHVKNIYPIIKEMDIVVHTSIEPEPFGLVVIEAMALGRPVIATKHGGPLEIITDHKDGLLVKPGDSQRLADALLELFADNERRLEMGQEARRTVGQRFNADIFIKSFKKIYSEGSN